MRASIESHLQAFFNRIGEVEGEKGKGRNGWEMGKRKREGKKGKGRREGGEYRGRGKGYRGGERLTRRRGRRHNQNAQVDIQSGSVMNYQTELNVRTSH
jgi:hypothetical protein